MVDVKEKQTEVELILTHSQSYPMDLNAEALIKKWAKAKSKFIDAFKGETMIRSNSPIRIYLSEEQCKKRFNEFLITLEDNGILTEELESFLRNNEKGFFENKVLSPYPSFNIPLGSKLSKSFRHFLSNESTVRWAQDMASRYIQENKIEGYLYLSIDPIDFLTLSENNENWWSCQTLDGDFRAGDLSYMVDDTTVIAYLANDKQEHMKCLPKDSTWISKKWRMLVHTDFKNCVYFNKQYPYESENLLNYTSELMIKHFGLKDFTMPTDFGFKIIKTQQRQELLETNQINAGGRIFDTRDIVDSSDYLGYCDIISSSTYAPIICVNANDLRHYMYTQEHKNIADELETVRGMFGIKIGAKVPCPCCGKEYLSKENSFLCDCCIAENDGDEDFYISCASCGHHIYDEDECDWMHGAPYCKECYTAMKQEDSVAYLEEEN